LGVQLQVVECSGEPTVPGQFGEREAFLSLEPKNRWKSADLRPNSIPAIVQDSRSSALTKPALDRTMGPVQAYAISCTFGHGPRVRGGK
jgi:hypothetical protein